MMELQPTFADYPAYVWEDGWRIAVAVRVQHYLSESKAWKRKLSDAHPDHGGTELGFRRVKAEEAKWRATEDRWFVQHGLSVPTFGCRASAQPAGFVHASDTGSRVMAVLKSMGVPATAAQMLDALEWPNTPYAIKRLQNVIARLRSRGAAIVTISDRQHATSYLLRSDAAYRQPKADSVIRRLFDLLADGAPHTINEIADRLHVPVGHVAVLVRRLPRHGSHLDKARGVYRLIAPEGVST